MATWVRSRWDEGDTTFFWEVGDDGWVTRAIELFGPDGRVQAAAVLTDVLAARDAGGMSAVAQYEARYGVVPEKPILDWDFPHERITHAAFENEWAAARQVLESER